MIGVMWVQWENESDKKVFCGAMVIGLCLAILCACTLIRKLHVVGGQARMAAPSVTLEGTEGLAWEDGIYGAGDKPQAFRRGKEGAEGLDLKEGREDGRYQYLPFDVAEYGVTSSFGTDSTHYYKEYLESQPMEGGGV